ncbi:MAG: hypothetical protein KF851_10445 [Pirellulaceae bacterium]|nr:hypothetical protein [Pirellulaceae bacterium]
MSRRKRQNKQVDPEAEFEAALTPDRTASDDQESSSSGRRRGTRSRRSRSNERRPSRLRWVMFLAFGLLVFVAIAPNLIGWTSLKDTVIGWAAKDFDGQVTVDSLSLGWLQPIQMTGLRAVDASGNSLVEVESLTSSNRLYQFLTGKDLGSFAIVRPKLNLILREGGSNLEDALKRYLDQEPTTTEPTTVPKISLAISEGQVFIASHSDTNPWELGKINAQLMAGRQVALHGDLSASVARGEQFGNFSTQFSIDDGSDQIQFSNVIAQTHCDGLPLGFLAPLMERVVGPVRIHGTVGGNIAAQLKDAGAIANVKFQETHVSQLQFAAPALLGKDVVQMAAIVANGEVTHDDQGIIAQKLNVSSDIGRLTADGQLNWRQFQRLTETGQLLETSFQLDGRIDLARLANLMPETIKLVDDTRVESGTLVVQVSSRPQQGAARIVVNVDSSNLVAVRDGQRLAWQQPLRFVSTIAQRDRSWALDEVFCESDFLNLRGEATLQRGSFQVDGDLAVLMERLGQFIDVGAWRLQGKLAGQLGWQIASHDSSPQAATLLNQPLNLNGNFTITEPLVSFPGIKPWRESQVELKVVGRGSASPEGVVSLTQGTLDAVIGNERLNAQLNHPITDLLNNPKWQATCTLQGQLAKWLHHAGAVVDLSFLNTDGQAEVQTQLLLDGQQLLLSDLKYIVRNWRFDGYGMKIREPEVSGTGVMRYDLGNGQILFPDLTLVCSAVAARGDRVTLDLSKHWDVGGNVAFRADAHRVLDWYGMYSAPDSVHFFGEVEGAIQLTSNPQAIVGQIQGQVNNFIAAQQAAGTQGPWTELLREPTVKFQSVAKLSQDFNRLELEGFQADAASVKLRADGSLDDIAGVMLTDLKGTWSPDWQRVQGLLDAYTYQMVRMTGRQDQAFAIRGPLFATNPNAPWPPAELQASTQIGWQQASVFLLPVEAAEVTASLGNGVAQLDTGVVPFSDGQVRLVAGLPLHAPQWVVQIPAGTIADKVALTPQICRDWMKFVNPLLADVATAQGRVSLESSGVTIPVADFQQASGRGVVHLNQVTVGAGPTAMKMIEAVETIRMVLRPMGANEPKDRSVWIRVDEQAVPFAVQGGRVHHEGMRMTMKDLTVRTTGSVGFDQSLNMIAEIPIAEDWLRGEEWMAALKGEVIRIPITGTVSQPKIDMQGIRDLSLNLARRTAENKLGGLVTEQTDRLQNRVGSELDRLQDRAQDQLGGQLDKLKDDIKDSKAGQTLNQLRGLLTPPRRDQ